MLLGIGVVLAIFRGNVLIRNLPTPKYLLAGITVAATLATSSSAWARHDVRVFMAESGVQFIESNAPELLPETFALPTIDQSFSCMDFRQSNTQGTWGVDKLKIDMPSNDRITVEIDFNIYATGDLYADDLYACFGEATCTDELNLDRGNAVLDFDLQIVNGRPAVTARDVNLNVNPDDFEFVLDECGFTGSALTTAIEFTEGWILDYIEDEINTVAETHLGPVLEDLLSGHSMESNYLRASVEDLYFPNRGISLTVDSAFAEPTSPDACMAEYDLPSPERAASSAAPDLIEQGASDINMALNFGLLNQALYVAWRKGRLCLTDKHIAALGVELDLSIVGAMLPGFPAGTEFTLEIKFKDYPRVRGQGLDLTSLVLDVEGVEVQVHGDRPDGTRNTLTAEIDMEATARLGVNPDTNAIFAQLVGMEMTHMHLADERDATGEGYDVARIQQMLHQAILPHMLQEMGTIPLTGPVFEAFDYAIILRSLGTNSSYATAGVDLFAKPKNDVDAPDTTIIPGPAVMNAHNAVIQVDGVDGQVPTDLLKYQVIVNDEPRDPTFIRDIRIGNAGVTATYDVSVAAVDLAGNVDPTPATARLLVDGVVPFVAIQGDRTRDADAGPTELRWTMSDDTTEGSRLAPRLEIYKLDDPADVLSAKLIETRELLVGATSATVDLKDAGGIYRVEVHVVDEAGNDSRSSLLLSSATGGGCSTGGTSGGSTAALLLMALGLVWRRRTRGSASRK